jgi:hypothetical protein
MKITINHKGSFKNTEKFIKKNITTEQLLILEKYAQEGLNALMASTPVDTGKTMSSWGYHISFTNKYIKLTYTNSNIVDNVPIAIVLQYGHATRDGSFIEGIDYINPAVRPIFNKISKTLWKEVTK